MARQFVAPVYGQNPYALVVLESPSREDAEKREPLVDRAGEALIEMLNQHGLELARLAIVHAVACIRPHPESDPDMRKAIACCKPLFDSATLGLREKVPVLAVGKWAAMQLTGVEKAIGTIRGFYDDTEAP